MLWAVLIALFLLGWWIRDVRRHPVRPCPSCGGSKRNAGSRSTAWGICGRCGGKGEVRRWGAGKGK